MEKSMVSEIRDAFNAAWPDGPASQPTMPNKAVIRSVGGTVQDRVNAAFSAIDTTAAALEVQIEAATEGYITSATWTGLLANPGTKQGQPGRVSGPDSGTHTDAISGQTVPNEGEYSWVTASTAWQKVGDLLVSKKSTVAADFIDPLGFVGARLSSDGTFLQNPPSRSYETIDTLDDEEFFSVSDGKGFKALSLSSDGLKVKKIIQDDADVFNEGFDGAPLIGGKLVSFAGSETHLYARNTLRKRSDLSLVRATVYSEALNTGQRSAYARTGDDDLVFDLQKCGSTVFFQTRVDEIDPDTRHQASMSAQVAPVAPSTGTTASVLMIGDSITNRSMAAWMAAFASSKGYTLSFLGTINGAGMNEISSGASGPLGEGREGWEFGDFTYAVTNRVSVVAPGSEATYLASDKTTKLPQNPFLRASTGGDSSSVIRNGNVFDYDYYLTRFSISTPDVVFVGIGTNDVRDLNQPDLGPAITDGLSIICGQILLARPSTKIAIWLPPVSRSTERDTVWDEYVEVISRLLTFVREQANPNIVLLPVWAMASQEVGFALSTGSVSETGIHTATLSDTVHLSPFNVAACAEILAAAASCAAQGTL